MKEFDEIKLQTEASEIPFKEPEQPSAPDPNVPDPYPVTDPIAEPEPIPLPPEPSPEYPPDVVF